VVSGSVGAGGGGQHSDCLSMHPARYDHSVKWLAVRPVYVSFSLVSQPPSNGRAHDCAASEQLAIAATCAQIGAAARSHGADTAVCKVIHAAADFNPLLPQIVFTILVV
jgi:hypothetical protein